LHYNESDNASSANLSRLQVHRHQLTVSEMNSLSLFIDVLRVHATVELVEWLLVFQYLSVFRFDWLYS